jgi:hypothetical protein
MSCPDLIFRALLARTANALINVAVKDSGRFAEAATTSRSSATPPSKSTRPSSSRFPTFTDAQHSAIATSIPRGTLTLRQPTPSPQVMSTGDPATPTTGKRPWGWTAKKTWPAGRALHRWLDSERPAVGQPPPPGGRIVGPLLSVDTGTKCGGRSTKNQGAAHRDCDSGCRRLGNGTKRDAHLAGRRGGAGPGCGYAWVWGRCRA